MKEYFTGKPCQSGHISARRVSQQTCVECKRVWSKRSYEKHKNGAVQQAAEKRATARDMERRRTNPQHLERRRTQTREAARRRLDKSREYSRDYYQTNIQRRLKTLLQVRIRRALLDQHAEKSQSTDAELGGNQSGRSQRPDRNRPKGYRALQRTSAAPPALAFFPARDASHWRSGGGSPQGWLPGTELRLMLEGFGNGVRRRRVRLFRQDRCGCEKRRRTQTSTSKSAETNTA